MVSLVLKTRNAGGATAADIATARILDRAVGELIEPELVKSERLDEAGFGLRLAFVAGLFFDAESELFN